MTEDGKYWKSKTIYLENVTGDDIVKEQNEINASETKYVVASQIFQIRELEGKVLYDCFIYYKDKHGAVKGL